MSAPGNTRAIAARKAAIRRRVRLRFGISSFDQMGLPGGKVIDAGLDDLAASRVSIASLLVSLAAPRLRREGVPVPDHEISDPDHKLYRLLEKTNADLAHARYLAYLRLAASFADACATARAT